MANFIRYAANPRESCEAGSARSEYFDQAMSSFALMRFHSSIYTVTCLRSSDVAKEGLLRGLKGSGLLIFAEKFDNLDS